MMQKICLTTAILTVLAVSSPALSAEWEYDGAHGPEHWGELYEICSKGQFQSPVDLVSTISAELDPIGFNYGFIPALSVINNGHTIQVPAQTGSSILVGDQEFELLQFHFHAPSEHTIDGKSFPMELHFVHKNSAGELGVVGVMLEVGAENDVIQKIWENIPAKGETTETDMEIDISSLVPKNQDYFRLMGSLTIPPCSEGVHWHVLKTPMTISQAQLDAYQALYAGSNRPVQDKTHRLIVEDK